MKLFNMKTLKLKKMHLFLIIMTILALGAMGVMIYEGFEGNSSNEGIPRNEIPEGEEDLYILKSQVVPPVCPKCPDVQTCNKKEKCPPCPACARCPEPAFECKKVAASGSDFFDDGTGNDNRSRPGALLMSTSNKVGGLPETPSNVSIQGGGQTPVGTVGLTDNMQAGQILMRDSNGMSNGPMPRLNSFSGFSK